MTSYPTAITTKTIGVLITLKEFTRKVHEPGFGYPAKKQMYTSDLIVYPQQVSQIPSDATHILWIPS
jgi:hypothetical protein